MIAQISIHVLQVLRDSCVLHVPVSHIDRGKYTGVRRCDRTIITTREKAADKTSPFAIPHYVELNTARTAEGFYLLIALPGMLKR